MARINANAVLPAIISNALMAFGSAIAAGLAGCVVVHFSVIDDALRGLAMPNALGILPLYLFTLVVSIIANGFGIAVSIIVLPVVVLIWPNVRFYNLMLAACFASGMLAWPITGALVGLNGWDPDALSTISGLSALMAALCGLYYPANQQLAATKF